MTANQPLDDPETYAIIGAAMAVHTELGCGFLEAVYKAKAHEAITAIDLAQAINYLRAARFPRALLLNFGGTSLTHRPVVWGGIGARRRERPDSSPDSPVNQSLNPTFNPSLNPPATPPKPESA